MALSTQFQVTVLFIGVFMAALAGFTAHVEAQMGLPGAIEREVLEDRLTDLGVDASFEQVAQILDEYREAYARIHDVGARRVAGLFDAAFADETTDDLPALSRALRALHHATHELVLVERTFFARLGELIDPADLQRLQRINWRRQRELLLRLVPLAELMPPVVDLSLHFDDLVDSGEVAVVDEFLLPQYESQLTSLIVSLERASFDLEARISYRVSPDLSPEELERARRDAAELWHHEAGASMKALGRICALNRATLRRALDMLPHDHAGIVFSRAMEGWDDQFGLVVKAAHDGWTIALEEIDLPPDRALAVAEILDRYQTEIRERIIPILERLDEARIRSTRARWHEDSRPILVETDKTLSAMRDRLLATLKPLLDADSIDRLASLQHRRSREEWGAQRVDRSLFRVVLYPDVKRQRDAWFFVPQPVGAELFSRFVDALKATEDESSVIEFLFEAYQHDHQALQRQALADIASTQPAAFNDWAAYAAARVEARTTAIEAFIDLDDRLFDDTLTILEQSESQLRLVSQLRAAQRRRVVATLICTEPGPNFLLPAEWSLDFVSLLLSFDPEFMHSHATALEEYAARLDVQVSRLRQAVMEAYTAQDRAVYHLKGPIAGRADDEQSRVNAYREAHESVHEALQRIESINSEIVRLNRRTLETLLDSVNAERNSQFEFYYWRWSMPSLLGPRAAVFVDVDGIDERDLEETWNALRPHVLSIVKSLEAVANRPFWYGPSPIRDRWMSRQSAVAEAFAEIRALVDERSRHASGVDRRADDWPRTVSIMHY